MHYGDKVIFLDRDGVINKYPGDTNYVTSWKDFEFIPGSLEGIRKLKACGYKLFVVSNQAGVSKGIYDAKALADIDTRLVKALRKYKTKLDGIYYCTHLSSADCLCRKPKVGLLNKAVAEHNLKPNVAFFIGDSFVDMRAGRAFGAKTVLLLSGREKISNRKHWEFEPDYIFDNLLVAAHYIASGHE